MIKGTINLIFTPIKQKIMSLDGYNLVCTNIIKPIN